MLPIWKVMCEQDFNTGLVNKMNYEEVVYYMRNHW